MFQTSVLTIFANRELIGPLVVAFAGLVYGVAKWLGETQ